MSELTIHNRTLIGWKEYCHLPDLGIDKIIAKVDTGAYTSCLHATEIKPFVERGQKQVRFITHPVQFNDAIELECSAPIVDHRIVRSSNGLHEKRYVIETTLHLGEQIFTTELSLTNRSDLNFRMLLGRGLLRGHFVIDVRKSFYQDKPIPTQR